MNNQFFLRTTSFKGSFSIQANNDTTLARVKSHSLFGTRGEATFVDSNLQFVPTSIFNFSSSIVLNDNVIGSIQPKWNTSVKIHLNNHDYLLKSRGMITRRFEVTDSSKRNILTLYSSFAWRYMSFNHRVTVDDPPPSPTDLLLLLIVSGFTANMLHRTTPS